ncbi:tRNA uridine-5-carboxymethylaminomethyl(34) synthesis GTPase MnmE [bacterium]|nr:tRNA uridine-5-carboxymethylaminomethyl(34) synthesis GTPase MnmE [bacterium]
MSNKTDTIAAIITPYGESSIGVLRLSGALSIGIADKLFKGKKGASLKCAKSHTLHFGVIEDKGSVIDEVLVSVMRKPNTYTGEDVVEISGHGNPFILQKILKLLLENGARMADHGEFTKRAFLNGKMDILQAESVAEIICAKTDEALSSSLRQLMGDCSTGIKEIADGLKEVLMRLETEIDFSEDDEIFLSEEDYCMAIDVSVSKIKMLLQSFDAGSIYKSGLNVVIAGKPNSGKSSLLNALVKTSKAIVSHIPGTTRDSLEHSINLKGVPCNLIDTAGLREAEDIIEKEGIKRAKQHIEKSHVVLFLTDASIDLTDDEKKRFKEIEALEAGAGRCIIVCVNKIDIKNKKYLKEIKAFFSSYTIIELSALTLFNIDVLEKEIINVVNQGRVDIGLDFIINARHKELLEQSLLCLDKIKDFDVQGNQEIIAFEIKNVLEFLGQILGTSFTEDLLDRIFSGFCIGK